MFDGVESPLTQTFGLGMFEPATPPVLTEIEAFFQGHNSPVQQEVCPLAGVGVSRDLAVRGYLPFEMSSVLYLVPGTQHTETQSGYAIRIASEEDADAYTKAATAGWEAKGELADMISNMTRSMFAAEGYCGFLAEQDGHTVATGGLIIHERVALFAGASTVPKARGQGAQQALLAARLEHARRSGCDLVMMVTEPGSGSQRNAERSGFRIAYTRTKWQLAFKR